MNQHSKKLRIQELKSWRVLFGILLVAFVVFVIVAIRLGWKWTGFTANSLWDWLKYLLIPAALAFAPCLWSTMSDRQGRQQARNRWRIFWIALFAMVLIAFIIMAIGSDNWGWTWTGFAGNKLWDWISLLFLPVTLTGVTIWFTEHQEQEQAHAFLALIPTTSLSNNPSPSSPASSAMHPQNKPLPVSQQAGAGLKPQRILPAAPHASQPPGRKLFSFGLSRRAALVYLAGSVIILGGIATEVWNFAVNKDTLASPVSAHVCTIDGYDSAITNGVMLGYNAQHTRVDPSKEAITPDNVPQLKGKKFLSTGGNIESAATVANNGLVYVSSSGPGNSGIFYALDARGGVKWHQNIGSDDFGNAPTVANGVVYMGAPDHYLYALDAREGNVKWKGCTGGRIGSSPTLANGKIYIGSDDGKLYAFNAAGCGSSKLCHSLWSYQTNKAIRSSPAVDNGMIFVGSLDGCLYAITIAGKLAWRRPYCTRGAIYSSPAVYKGIVYVGSNDGKLYAIDAVHGTLCWDGKTKRGIDSSPAVYKGVVYVGSKDGKLYAFNAVNGRTIWTAPTGDAIESSPTIANGVLFVGSDDGNFYAFDVSKHKRFLLYHTKRSIVSSPIVADSVVYVGSNDGNLYAFSLSGGA
ncbi:MAG TPA: PQQ-binding-like beta-propeller repeat protein [Ktedonobacteraceae bacterium]|nr:PQQ-binding-like beta-propeller repeat protein [Ktedonobacteraceae bacterium]